MKGSVAASLLAVALAAQAQTPPEPPPPSPAESTPAAQTPAPEAEPPAAAPQVPAPKTPPATPAGEPAPVATRAPAPKPAPAKPPSLTPPESEPEVAALRREVARLQSELDAERAAAVPPPEADGPVPPPVRAAWEWLVVVALLGLAGGFVLGWRILDRRIRRKYGGLRIY